MALYSMHAPMLYALCSIVYALWSTFYVRTRGSMALRSIIYGSMTTSIQEASGGGRMRGVGLHRERRRSFQDRKLALFLLLLLLILLLLFIFFFFLYIPTYPPSPANTIPLTHFTCTALPPLSALPRISRDRKNCSIINCTRTDIHSKSRPSQTSQPPPWFKTKLSSIRRPQRASPSPASTSRSRPATSTSPKPHPPTASSSSTSTPPSTPTSAGACATRRFNPTPRPSPSTSP